MKIFATVGTSKFDELIIQLDKIASSKKELDIIAQIGFSDYKPSNFTKYFKFTRKIDYYINWADVVISHGGAGTIYDILKSGKKAIVIPNKQVVTEHQAELVKKLNELGYIMTCSINTLAEAINRCINFKPKKYIKPTNKIAYLIDKFTSQLF